MILTLADYRTLTNTVSGIDDSYITELLTVVQSQIENFCDRKFDSQDYSEWYKYSRYLILREYPVTNVKFLGTLQKMATFSSDDYNYELTNTALNVTDNTLTTTTVTFGGAITTLTDIKTAIETAIPTITLTIDSGYTNASYKLLRVGTGKDVYGAVRSVAQTKLIEDESRTLELLADSSFIFFYASDYCTDVNMYLVYTAGYTASTMPLDLQMVEANIVSDISNAQTSGITGLVTSETITNYSWSSSTELLKNVGKELDNYTDVLDKYVKKVV